MRGLLVLLGFLAAALAAAVLALPRFIDEPVLRERLLLLAERSTGHRLAVEGAVRLELTPWPRLSVDRVAVGTPETGRLTADRIDVDLALPALLVGRLEPARLRLVRPQLSLRRLPADPLTATLSALERHDDGRAVEVLDGSLLVAQPSQGWPMRIDELDVQLAWEPERRTFTVLGEGRIGVEPVRLDLTLQPAPDGPASLRLQLASVPPAAPFTASFQGSVTPDASASGRLRLAAPQGQLPTWLAAPSGLVGLPALPGAMEAAGQLSATPQRVVLDELELNLVDNPLRGRFALERAAESRMVLLLEGTRAEVGADLERALRALATIPAADLAGRLELRLASLAWRGGEVRNVRFEAEHAVDGSWSLPRLDAVLPGETSLRWQGEAAGRPDALAGNFTFQASELRPFLSWLGIEAADLPPGGLTSLDLAAECELSRDHVALRGIDARLDATSLTGSADWRGGQRPSLALALAADRLNTGLYRIDAAALDWPRWRKRLASVDAELAASVDRLSHDRWRGGKLSLRAATSAGRLRLDDLLLIASESERIRVSGKTDLDGEAYEAMAELDASPTSLAPLLGLKGGAELAALPPVRLSGALQGGRDAAGVQGHLQAEGIDATLTGSMGGPFDWRTLDLAGHLDVREPGNVLRALGWVAEPVPGSLASTFVLRREGGAFDAKLNGKLGDSAFEGRMALSRGERPFADLAFAADALDLQLVQAAYDAAALRFGFPAGEPWQWPGAWPRQTLRWSWLDDLDLKLDLAVAALRREGESLPGVRLAASLRDDRLAVTDLGLPLAGGELGGKVTLEHRGGHAVLGADLTLARARAEQLAELVAPGSGIAGELDLSGRLVASGLSLADLVGTLAGEGELTLRHGRLGGVTFPPLPPAETILDPGVEVLLLQGPLAVERGVVTAGPPGLELTFPGGEARALLRLDLLAWLAELRLEGHRLDAEEQVLVQRLIGAPGRLRPVPEGPAD